jgi:hypothetical protein
MRFEHVGLYGGAAASTWAEAASSEVALAQLVAKAQDGSLIANAQLACHAQDSAAAERAVALLGSIMVSPEPPDDAERLIGLSHAVELLRPTLQAHGRLPETVAWLQDCIASLTSRLEGAPFLAGLHRDALYLLGGIVLEDAASVERGLAAFRDVIASAVRPRGFIQPAVEPTSQEGGTAYERHVRATRLLVLMAQAATASLEWNAFEWSVRGVSVLTPAIFPIYQYFVTDKWKFDADLQPEAVQQIFRERGGWLEMAQVRLAHRDISVVLLAMRPVWDESGGGMTTLTHGLIEKPRRRRLFG